MAWDGIFKLAATEGKRELNLKKESLLEEDAYAIEHWTDLTLFKVRGLNHLQLSGFSVMRELHPQLAQLNYLLELIVVHNGLETLPDELGQLSRLRLLDASHNKLSRLPSSLYQLSTLHILLLGHNRLTGESFPASPNSTNTFPVLQHASLVDNQLEVIPGFVYWCASLTELVASGNRLSSLLPDVEKLISLKQLYLENNFLTALPPQLGCCSKLRMMNFENNPLSDKRLMKIISQHGATKPKAVLDYLSAKIPGKKSEGKKKKGKQKQQQHQLTRLDSDEEEDDEDDVVEFSLAKPAIRIVRPDRYLEVYASDSARRVRPYLVCAVARDLQLDSEETMTKFIGIQVRQGCGRADTSDDLIRSVLFFRPGCTIRPASGDDWPPLPLMTSLPSPSPSPTALLLHARSLCSLWAGLKQLLLTSSSVTWRQTSLTHLLEEERSPISMLLLPSSASECMHLL